MDRKQIVDQTGPRKSTNGPSSRGPSFEMKKVSKDEENYFEGTGVAKKKQGRKPRPEVGPPLAPPVPAGFTVTSGPGRSGPPPVNAWSLKKGSALFNKGEPEVDEEDEIMQLVKKESMKTLEEDRKRQERVLMMSGMPSPLVSKLAKLEKEPDVLWKEEGHQRSIETTSSDSYGNHSSPKVRDRTPGNSSQSSNNFTSRYESDSDEESPVEQRRPRKSLSPATPTDKSRADSRPCEEFPKEHILTDYDDDNYVETSDRFSPRSVPISADVGVSTRPKSASVPINNQATDDRFCPRSFDTDPSVGNAGLFYKSELVPATEQDNSIPTKERDTEFTRPYKSLTPKGMMIPERESATRESNDLADDFKSTLTFGDTGGLFESLQRGQSNLGPPNVDDVDLFLHKVMRHDPPSTENMPSSIMTEPDIFKPEDSFKASATPVADLKSDVNNEPDINNLLDCAFSSQLSESSSNLGSFDSLDKQTYNYEASPQASSPVNQVPFPFNLAGNQDFSNLTNQNMLAQMGAAYMRGFIPPTVAIPGLYPSINPVTGQPQFMPPMVIPGQDMSNPFYQQMAMSSYYAQLAMMQNQTRQEQGSFGEIHQNATVVSSQAPTEAQPQIRDETQIPRNAQLQQQLEMQTQNQTLHNQQISLPNLQMCQSHQNKQIPQVPQMPHNPLTLPNYPINQNQQVSQTSPTQPMYQMNQNQPISQIPQNSFQQTPQPTCQMNQDHQTSQMLQNASNLLQSQMNQNQQTSQTLQSAPNLFENYHTPLAQDGSNPMQTHRMDQDQQMPLNARSLQNCANQKQPMPQAPQASLPQYSHYQAQPQAFPAATSEHNLASTLDSHQPNEYQHQPVPSDGNQVPQPGPGKNREDIIMKYHQAWQTFSQLHQQMGVQMSVPVPIAVPSCYARMPQPHYPQMDLQMSQMYSSLASSMLGSPLGGYESTESHEQAAPPNIPPTAPGPTPAPNPMQFTQMPDVAPRGRGMGRRL